MERIFHGDEPLAPSSDRILACSDRYSKPVAERILPDGGIHLIFNLGDLPSGERGAGLPALAMGMTCEATRIVLAGSIEQVCVRLRAGTAAAILGVPAGAIADLGVGLDALWGRTAADILDQLHGLSAGTERSAWISAVLRDKARSADRSAGARTASEALRLIAASGGRLRIGALAARLGVTDRRLQQLFYENVGLSPKATCRLARFRDVLARRRRQPTRSWAQLALDAGFYDQAHLANEVKAFTGVTPSALDGSGDFGFLQDALHASA